jgi:hypothetical protein
MLLDRPIPKALFYSHVRLEAKRNALDALSCFGTDRNFYAGCSPRSAA